MELPRYALRPGNFNSETAQNAQNVSVQFEPLATVQVKVDSFGALKRDGALAMTALLRKDRSGEASLRDLAFSLIKQKSFSTRAVQLSSGVGSNFYFDMKFTMLDPQGSNLLAELVLDKMARIGKVDYVGGLELGAVPLIGPIVALSYQIGRPIPGLIVRKEAKKHGSQRLVEGADDLRGKNVVIVDDVTTSGASAMKSIEALREQGAIISLVISIVDREQGASELYAKQGLPFDPLFRASEFLNAE